MKIRVRGVIARGDKLFLVQHRGYTTWCLPGGGIDEGEGLVQALKREITEELGVEAVVGKLLAVHQFKENGIYQGPEFFFEITNTDDFLNLDLSKATHAQDEIAIAEFKDPKTTDNLKPAFLANLINQQDISVVLE